MNIPEELLMRGLQWFDMHDNGKMMRIWDEQQNLGILLEFDRFEMHPTDNKALAESLVSVGLHKADGTALDTASMSRIKKVVLNLNTPN
jgi:hypothetical protein